MTDLVTRPQRDNHGRFLPGNTGCGGGRPRGSRNRLGEMFLQALAQDFDEHGAEAIAECRLTNPAVYVRVVASLLPREIEQEAATDFGKMTAEELENHMMDM